MARIWRYFIEFGRFRGARRKSVRDNVVVKKSSRSLSHLLMSFLFTDCRMHTASVQLLSTYAVNN